MVRIEPLPPKRLAHPFRCHNPGVPDRDAMNAILFAPRTACGAVKREVAGELTHFVVVVAFRVDLDRMSRADR